MIWFEMLLLHRIIKKSRMQRMFETGRNIFRNRNMQWLYSSRLVQSTPHQIFNKILACLSYYPPPILYVTLISFASSNYCDMKRFFLPPPKIWLGENIKKIADLPHRDIVAICLPNLKSQFFIFDIGEY